MKNKFLLAVGLMFGMATLPLKAQVKIGFINADYILSQMPEAKQVEEDLKNTQKQYETLYQGKVKEFQDKLAAFEKLNADTKTPDIIKQDKEKELQNLQTSIQEFQQNSQSSLQKKQAQLLQPLLPAKKRFQTQEKKNHKRVLEMKHLLQPMAKIMSEHRLYVLIAQ